MMIEQQSQRSASPTSAALNHSGEEINMLSVQIIETGEIKTLSIVSAAGVDFIYDLIGNAGMLGHPSSDGGFERTGDDGPYTATAATYAWWADYIDGLERTEEDLGELQSDLDDAGLDGGQILQERYYALVGGVDMEDERSQAVDLMEHIREEYLAAQTMGERL